MSNRTYDRLKFIALIGLPAVGALYFAIAQIWGLPKAEEVVGSVVAIDTFLGALLGIQKKAYDNSDEKYDGVLDLNPEDPGFKVDHTLEELVDKKDVILKVKADNVNPPPVAPPE